MRERTVTLEQWAELSGSLDEQRSIDYAHRRGPRSTAKRAQSYLRVSRRPEREALLALADYVLSRDR